MRELLAISLLAFLAACSLSFADSTTTKERSITKIAESIYGIRHPDAPDGFPQSNTTVIIGERGVFVIDSCLLPSSTKQDIAQIRQWTSKPVLYLLNTHWHFDHTLGNALYAEAFPGVQIIAHRHTNRMMRDFNPGAVARYPLREQRFKKILESGKDPDGKPLTDGLRKDYEQALAGLAPVAAELKDAKQVVANLVFDSELEIDLGNTQAEVKFIGRGNTGGDTIVYLPKEKLLITGDLLDHPVQYMFGGFPLDHVETLEKLARFEAQTIVPGHGDILRDKRHIQAVHDMIKAVNDEVDRLYTQGKTQEEVQELIPKNLDVAAWKKQFAGDDADSQSFFDQSFAALVKGSFNQQRMR
jgi:cyclase